MPLRIAIVEDHPETLAEYAGLLATEPDLKVVACCETVDAALAILPSAKPEVVLMDLGLGAGSGIECTRRLRALLPEVLILVITAAAGDVEIFEAILAGAHGYILKSEWRGRFLAAIREVVQGGSPMTPIVARKVLQYFHAYAAASAELASLSPRERQTLELAAAGRSTKQIAAALGLSAETVANYFRRLFEKLHVHSRAEAVAKLRAVPGPRVVTS